MEHESASGADGSERADGENHGSGSNGSEGSSGSSSASAAFAAGRAQRKDGTSDGGVGRTAGDAPQEAPTVEQAQPSSEVKPSSGAQPSSEARTEAVSTSAAAQGSPTAVQPRPELSGSQPQRSPARSGPSAVGRVLRSVLNLLATVVVIVGLLCAAVLVVFVVLGAVAINPQNVVAQAVSSVADRLVGPFRDLFLIPDPVVGPAVNYGLAALCWLVAALIVARVLRAIGRAFP